MSWLRKSINFECKANMDKRIFEGYASTWKRDSIGDQISRGAFSKTINEKFTIPTKNGMNSKIKVLWQHGAPLGRPLEMFEDSKGLYVRAYVPKTQLGDDALELMREGIVDEMSIGYKTHQEEWSADMQTKYLNEVELFEFSPVTFGCNADTSITGVKSFLTIDELMDFDLERLQKEGRVFSRANLARLRQAQDNLLQLIAQIESSGAGEPNESEVEKDLITQQQKALEEFVKNYRFSIN